MTGIYGNKISLQYKTVKNPNTNEKIKLGTYGIIKGHSAYIAGAVENNKEYMLDFGYVFEKLILFLTDKGIGTCWMAGTFDRKALNLIFPSDEGHIIPAMSPLGYPKKKTHLKDRTIRKLAGSDSRIDFDKLFYINDSKTPYNLDEFKEEFDMVRIGPSASNKQPWRFIVKESDIHIYLKRTPDYGSPLKLDVQMIDIGIALCHLDLVSKQNKKNYFFKSLSNEPIEVDETLEYIITYKKKI